MASELRVDQLKYTAAGSSTVPNISLNNDGSVTFGGDIDIGNNDLLVNGQPFSTLPPQIPEGQDGTTAGAVLKSDGVNAFWEIVVSFEAGFAITRGYPAAGYQSASSWRNVNRCTHATFTMSNLGDLLTSSDAYTAGAQNTSMRAYVFNTPNSWNGTGAQVSTFSMVTETNAGTGTNMATSRQNTSVMKRDFKYAYVFGNNNEAPDRYDLTNDTVTTITGASGTGANNPACGYGETTGLYKCGSAYLFAFATQSWSSWGSAPGTDGTNKTVSSRRDFSYWNEAGGYQTNTAMTRRSSTSGANLQSVGKPGVTGEETFHTGMDYGFMNGMYNGAQNNTGGSFNYSTHAFTFSSSLNSIGPGGRASGAAIEYGTLATGYTGV